MDIKKCVFCGRTVAPELPHYEIGDIHICLRCGGYKTLSNLAATGAGFSVVMEEPIEGSLPGQTYPPRIEVENVDGELVEKEPEEDNFFAFRNLTYGRSAVPDNEHPAYHFAELMRDAMSKKFGPDAGGIPEECKKAGHMNLCDFFTDSTVDYLLSDTMGNPRYTVEEEKAAIEKSRVKNKALEDSAFKAAGVTPEETGTAFPPNGVIHNCELFPCAECKYLHGELNECVKDGVE